MSGMEAMRRMVMSRKGNREVQGTASRKGKGDAEDALQYRVASGDSRMAADKAASRRRQARFEREQRAALELLKTRKAIMGILPRKNEYDI